MCKLKFSLPVYNKYGNTANRQTSKPANKKNATIVIFRYSRATLRTGQLDSLDSCTAIHTNLILCAYQKLSTYISSAISI